jgi:drug/metabolite transporter (DMT)-like permease
LGRLTFLYPQIILMSLSSWFFFDQPPDLAVAAGSLIVVGSGLYIWMRERRLQRPVTVAAPKVAAEPEYKSER